MERLNSLEIVGIIAGTLTTGAYFPQLLATWRARSGRGLTYSMLSILNMGLALWIVYGLYLHSIALVMTNVVTLLFAGSILAMKIAFDLRDRRSQRALAVAAGQSA